MPRKNVDALAVWDARSRTLIGRIDAVLDEAGSPAAGPASATPLESLARRAMTRQSPPPGEILTVETPPDGPLAEWARPRGTDRSAPVNMGPQPERIDHWDAYVCRFDDVDDDGVWDRPTP